MFLLKIAGGLWRKRRVGIEQSMCYCNGEKEAHTHFRQDQKAQTLEKCTTSVKVL